MRPLTSAEQKLVAARTWIAESLSTRLALRYDWTRRDELFSVGLERLVQAVLSFRPGAATFDTYAYACVKGAMLDHVRSTAPRGRLSSAKRKLLAVDARCDGLGRDDTDLGAATPEEGIRNLEDFLVGRASELALVYWLGIEQSTPNEDELIEERTRQAKLANVRALVALQTEEVREFYRRYYEEDATLAEIASAKGVSVKTVQRIQTKLKVAVQTAMTMHDSGAP